MYPQFSQLVDLGYKCFVRFDVRQKWQEICLSDFQSFCKGVLLHKDLHPVAHPVLTPTVDKGYAVWCYDSRNLCDFCCGKITTMYHKERKGN